MRISDWSSDVCSSDLFPKQVRSPTPVTLSASASRDSNSISGVGCATFLKQPARNIWQPCRPNGRSARSEEHTSELQSLMRISYAVFCLKKKKQKQNLPHDI